MDSSYRRYRQYRANRQQYKVDQIAAPIVMLLILGFLTKYWWMVVTVITVIFILKCMNSGNKKNVKTQKVMCEIEKVSEQKEETVLMKTTEIGYVNRNNQKNNGRTDIPGTDFGQWFYDMECLDCGHKYHANGSNIYEKKCPNCQETKSSEKKTSTGKSTEIGYINRNNQRNNGKTDIPGTGNGQWFYEMECLGCGHKYHANGHDIWLRKCPKCQGGTP